VGSRSKPTNGCSRFRCRAQCGSSRGFAVNWGTGDGQIAVWRPRSDLGHARNHRQGGLSATDIHGRPGWDGMRAGKFALLEVTSRCRQNQDLGVAAGGYQDRAAGKACLTRHSREAVLSSLHVPNPIALTRLGGRSRRGCAVGHRMASQNRRIGRAQAPQVREPGRRSAMQTVVGQSEATAGGAGTFLGQGHVNLAKMVAQRCAEQPAGRTGTQPVHAGDGHVGNVSALL
jgi:hypothetical protein